MPPAQAQAQPQGLLMLGLEQVYCKLSWQKLCGEAGWVKRLRGGEGELQVPWPQVTASEARHH